MAGSPKKRARKEAEAIKRLEISATAQALNKTLTKEYRKYSPEVADQIVDLVASGVPIDDSTLRGAVISPGVAARLNLSPATIYQWQIEIPGLQERIARARVESAHRIAERMLSLVDIALSHPELANAVRVAGDILKWQAMVRNRVEYGDNVKVDMRVEHDTARLLLEARARIKHLDATDVPEAELVGEKLNVWDAGGTAEIKKAI